MALVWASTGAALDSAIHSPNIGGPFVWLAAMGLVCTAILALLVTRCPRSGLAQWHRNLRDALMAVAVGILLGDLLRFALVSTLSRETLLLTGLSSTFTFAPPILMVAWLLVEVWLRPTQVLPPPPY